MIFILIPLTFRENKSLFGNEDIINWTKSYTNIKNIYFSLNNFYTFEDYNKLHDNFLIRKILIIMEILKIYQEI